MDCIGTNIKNLRKRMYFSRTYLAQRCDLSVGYISQVERNHIIPSERKLKTICRVLNVEVHEIMTEGMSIEMTRLYINLSMLSKRDKRLIEDRVDLMINNYSLNKGG